MSEDKQAGQADEQATEAAPLPDQNRISALKRERATHEANGDADALTRVEADLRALGYEPHGAESEPEADAGPDRAPVGRASRQAQQSTVAPADKAPKG